jgi:hypothetical protein
MLLHVAGVWASGYGLLTLTLGQRKPWCLNTHDLGFVRDNTAGREPRAAGQ